MNNDPIIIEYLFRLENDSEEYFKIRLDRDTLELQPENTDNLPHWTEMAFSRCPQCRLSPETSHCPPAVNLFPIIQRFEKIISFDTVNLQVTTEERVIVQKTTAQKALGSIIGLVIASSACPDTSFFKPMARFHLPLANEEETFFRATSTFMLLQYFTSKMGGLPDFNLEGLKKIYLDIQKINVELAHRLRTASNTDSSINAIVLLDMYAKSMPYVITHSLEELRYLFEPFLKSSQSDVSPPDHSANPKLP
ncbi:MAG: hypothetical protein OEY01_15490 [Desulfobulbaceae bacterium]|nr:hypothetical protein [Desulfobulbaceae bacterium]HIJ79970.1 hypothetical protein [Deltaproteobacteria bacterium]